MGLIVLIFKAFVYKKKIPIWLFLIEKKKKIGRYELLVLAK